MLLSNSLSRALKRKLGALHTVFGVTANGTLETKSTPERGLTLDKPVRRSVTFEVNLEQDAKIVRALITRLNFQLENRSMNKWTNTHTHVHLENPKKDRKTLVV
ncbi:hypothetical protein BaRGS_00018277 [Batillaria attramentaria]|uniref:Uncharacterized protein n=1 Tax=Batillaria attramentaria TaxID=370345 RepID=A0ABD0KTX3_9CAEN